MRQKTEEECQAACLAVNALNHPPRVPRSRAIAVDRHPQTTELSDHILSCTTDEACRPTPKAVKQCEQSFLDIDTFFAVCITSITLTSTFPPVTLAGRPAHPASSIVPSPPILIQARQAAIFYRSTFLAHPSCPPCKHKRSNKLHPDIRSIRDRVLFTLPCRGE